MLDVGSIIQQSELIEMRRKQNMCVDQEMNDGAR